MLFRFVKNDLKTKLHKGKAILLLGGRQTGKTNLLKIITGKRKDTLWLFW